MLTRKEGQISCVFCLERMAPHTPHSFQVPIFAVGLIGLLLPFSTIADIKSGTSDGTEEWGYTDVRPGAHLFWWLYYSTPSSSLSSNVELASKPLIMWLQGGPGASGVGFGNFEELGPLDVNLEPREYTWLKSAHLLFVDNPVGTGFSYVDNDTLLTQDNAQVTSDLMAFVSDFFTSHPRLSSVPFYIFCESYGGKYTSQLASAIAQALEGGSLDINFKGVAMGDSWISPIDFMKVWGSQLRTLGLLDDYGQAQVDSFAVDAETAIKEGRLADATTFWGEQEEIIDELTDHVDFYNVLNHNVADDFASLSGTNVIIAQARAEELLNRALPPKCGNADQHAPLKEEGEGKGTMEDPMIKFFRGKDGKEEGTDVRVENSRSVEDGVERGKQCTRASKKRHMESANKLLRRHLAPLHAASLNSVMNGPVKKKLGIIPKDLSWGMSSEAVFMALYSDFMNPTIDMVDDALARNVNVTVFSGQLDLICCTDGTMNWMQQLKWPWLSNFQEAPRSTLYCPGDKVTTGGFVKEYRNLRFVWVMNAGHMVPADNGCVALEMVKIVTRQG
eukprot:TRINITY_DN4600_c0_g2_i1.p1 TRINITY_DN4600_c0_g2~~TRINITY_DN4600_c0_g2_i1.p1  ORF type:complete len:561 (-),score=89.06 TRINITY_DN4600_c0_g2_i1:324-2006(-)